MRPCGPLRPGPSGRAPQAGPLRPGPSGRAPQAGPPAESLRPGPLRSPSDLIPIILVGNIDFMEAVLHARGMTTYDRTERRYVDLLRVASSLCRLIAT